jgi:hypothetical protein
MRCVLYIMLMVDFLWERETEIEHWHSCLTCWARFLLSVLAPFASTYFLCFWTYQPDLGIGFRVFELYINLGPFDTNYIIFRNVEVFNNFFFPEILCMWRKTRNLIEYLGIYFLSKWNPQLFNKHVLKWPRYYGIIVCTFFVQGNTSLTSYNTSPNRSIFVKLVFQYRSTLAISTHVHQIIN